MTPEQCRLLCIAAQSFLAHRDCGRKCDPEAVRWAETVLRNNPRFDPLRDSKNFSVDRFMKEIEAEPAVAEQMARTRLLASVTRAPAFVAHETESEGGEL